MFCGYNEALIRSCLFNFEVWTDSNFFFRQWKVFTTEQFTFLVSWLHDNVYFLVLLTLRKSRKYLRISAIT